MPVGLRAITVELEDLPPPLRTAEVAAGQPDQRVALAHGHGAAGGGDRRRRCRHRRQRQCIDAAFGGRRRQRIGDGGRCAAGDRQQHEGGGHQPLRQQADAGPRHRWRDGLDPRVEVDGAAQLGDLQPHLHHDRHHEPGPEHPAGDGQEPDDDRHLVAQLDAGSTGPRVADEQHQEHRHGDGQNEHRADRRHRANGRSPPHGVTLPVRTPSDGSDVDDSDTSPTPGSSR